MQGKDWWEGFGESAPLRAMHGIDWREGFGEGNARNMFHFSSNFTHCRTFPPDADIGN
jgi:GTP-dependent phosphoenolpyruvate carboxykinase